MLNTHSVFLDLQIFKDSKSTSLLTIGYGLFPILLSTYSPDSLFLM